MTRAPLHRTHPNLTNACLAALLVGATGAALVAGSWTLPEPVFEPLGPGAFPLATGLILIVLAVLMIIAAVRPSDIPTGFERPRGRRDLAFFSIVLTGLYGLAMDRFGVGFPIATSVFLFSMTALLAGRHLTVTLFAIPLALILGFGLHAVFTQFFYIDLPA